MDFASIGIKVVSDGVQQGADRLDDLAGAATRAEGAAESLTPAMRQAGAAAQQTAQQTSAASAALGRQSASVQAAGLSTKQYAQALRLLPAQITDVVTGLASGQSPFIVAIQQGGQLRDSFGGFGNTLRAVTSFLGPVKLALAGIAVVGGVLSKAFLDGQREAQAFASAVILNGNAAGTTTGELRGLAVALDGIVGTESAAADALAKLASTGRVGARELGMLAEAALRLERETGTPVQETVKLFASLGDKPAAAAAKLNEQWNFLTVATYDQIRALEEQGRVSEAAALAQTSFASVAINRTTELEERLGSLQTAARATGEFFKEMWDSIAGIGRPQTEEERIDEIAQEIKRLDTLFLNSKVFVDPNKRRQRDALSSELGVLQDRVLGQQARARAEADAAAASRKTIAEREKNERDAETRRRQRAQEADQLRRAQLGVDLATIQRGVDAEVGAYSRRDELLEARRRANLITEQQYFAEKQQLLEQQTAAEVRALEAQAARLAQQKLSGAEALQRDSEIADLKQQILELEMRLGTESEKSAIAQKGAFNARTKAAQEATLATKAYLETLDRQFERELQAQGLGRRARDFNAGRNRLEDSFLDMRAGVERERGQNGDAETARQLAEIDNLQRQALDKYDAFFAKRTAQEQDWRTGASAALQDYFDEASNVAGQVQDALGGAFRGLEDALVEFAQTGKLSFKDLADSIIADLIRIQARAALSQIFGAIAGAVSGFGGGGGTGGLSSNQLAALNLPGRATGGPVSAGQPYIVGEKGPELMVPSRSGLIVPNHMLGGGGQNVSLTINAAPNTDVATFWAMGERLKEEVRGLVANDAFRNRGLWQRTGA